MDNQHRKIVGYRELDQAEIDLMNMIKTKDAGLLALVTEVIEMNKALADQDLVQTAEAMRWASIAKTHFQEGCMALTRAVAKPVIH